MQLILLEKVRNLGDLGDTVSVKAGYGRNFLIPNGKAVPANKDNVEKFEARRAELEAKAAALLHEAEARAEQLKDFVLKLELMASDEGKLYGSVGTHEVAEAAVAAGKQITKSEVMMPNGAIHHVGEYDIEIQLHTDVVATIKVAIEATG